MMRFPSVVALLLAITPLAFAMDGPSTELSDTLRSELLAVRERVWQAWFSNDQVALKRLLPAELIAINNGEPEWQGLQKTLTSAQEFAARGGKLVSLRFDRTEIQIYGDVAVLYSMFALETEEKGKRTNSSGRATEIFQRRGKFWVNTGWHLDSGS